ncbi:hypothetical protein O181_040550 [Austropuccinia psidii MF-1]|uniref:CCHC-type domain-containing protein n=1 Tax=Austropuccinia psidii MF-1 TaxID=1389203 RepID=A0A9Q3DDD2_9BASI|nr:hypothetical protein [Austropuccinia psidii MF-1]
MENAFESSIYSSEKDKPLTWFLKQKDRLSALHPDMSDSMINMKILRKCGGELEDSIECKFVEPYSTEDYINSMEDIITRTRISKTWTSVPMESKMVSETSTEDKRPERPVLKCHKCGRTSHLANTCTKMTNIHEAQVIEEVQCTEEREESDLDSAVSVDKPVENYPIENLTAFFEVIEVHTHLSQYSEDFYNLINFQDARMCKPKLARAKVNLDTGALCTCGGKDYLQAILPGWKNHLSPIEGVQFGSSSNNMYPLVIFDTNLVFPHPAGSVRMKTEIVVMDNCTSQDIIIGNDYLNIYGIDINEDKDRYFTIGENKRQKFAFSNMPNKISEMNDLIDVLCTYNNAFVSDNEPLGSIIRHEVDITFNIERPYPSVLRRPAYPASLRAREALEKHIQELIQLSVLRKLGHNEEVEVTTPVIMAWHNDKSRMVGAFRALNTYTVPDSYPIPRIQEILTQFSKAEYITLMDELGGLHQTFLTPKTRKLLRIITYHGIYEYLRIQCGIKNAASHYQRMMNTIFPTELSEGWIIIYIDDIIICSDSWSLHLERVERVLYKVTGVKMKI